MNVRDLKSIPEGDVIDFESILVFKRSTNKVAKTGTEFLVVELADRTGAFITNCFADTPVFNFFSSQSEGVIVQIKGRSDHYQGRFSPKLSEVNIVQEEELNADAWANLIEMPPESPEELWNELQGYIGMIEHEGLRGTVAQVMEEIGDSFKVCPAAVAMHHAYRYGLLEHTVHVTRAGVALLPLYTEVNKDLAIAGMILHDVGKTIEYEGSLAAKRSRTGVLQGHVVLGYRIARKAAIQNKVPEYLLERLEHIILSHQGELEWGAAAMAATPEAVFVSMVDNLDAKMGMVQRVLRNTPEGEAFSDFLPGLKASILVEPVSTEEPAGV